MPHDNTSLVDQALRSVGMLPPTEDPAPPREKSLRTAMTGIADGPDANPARSVLTRLRARGGSNPMARRVARVMVSARHRVSAIEAIAQVFFGSSIDDEWVGKPFAGNWDAVTSNAATWRTIATELESLRTDVDGISGNVEQWQGAARDAYLASQTKAVAAFAPVARASVDISDALDSALTLARTILDIVDTAITLAVGICTRVAAEQSVPAAGQAFVLVENFTTQAVQLSMNVTEALDSFARCTDLLDAVVASMNTARQDVSVLRRNSAAGQSAPAASSPTGMPTEVETIQTQMTRLRTRLATQVSTSRNEQEARADVIADERRAGVHGQSWQALQQRIDMHQAVELDVYSGVDTSPEAQEARATLTHNLTKLCVRIEGLRKEKLVAAHEEAAYGGFDPRMRSGRNSS